MKREQRIALIIVLAAIVAGSILAYILIGFSGKDVCASNELKEYIGQSVDECARIDFSCDAGTTLFQDSCGCGCERMNSTLPEQVKCTAESRSGDVCIQIYQPVCGWFDPTKIQCVRYPCAETYGNSCEACHDSKVKAWSAGECPA